MKFRLLILLFLLFPLLPAFAQTGTRIRISDKLELVPLTEQVLMHVSHEEHPKFGRFTSNGLLYISKGEAIILDTPSDEELSGQLLQWLAQNRPEVRVKAVIVNHFHHDCLGGLAVFHRAGIPSYSHSRTVELVQLDTAAVPATAPKHTFTDKLRLKAGGAPVEARYFGPAHSPDNIVVWLPQERVLFGGCMIKSLGSGRGNLSDADVQQWPLTVQRVKQAYPRAAVVVPGHGEAGNTELLDFTIRLFSEEKK